jgi:hypothetical protein
VHRSWLAVCGAALALTLAACSSSSGSSSLRPEGPNSPVATVAPKPSGADPSESSKMVCESEAQSELATALGVTQTQVTTPTWVDHTYTCTYVYPNGSFTLQVKELDSAALTTGYFNSLAALMGRQPTRLALAGGAFVTTNGSVVARKDWKVLLVDVTHLPASFGQPPQDQKDNAISIAATILSCWSGA